MKIKDYLIRSLKKSYRFVFRKKFLNPICNMDRQSVNDDIYSLLMNDSPCMISRFGTTELNCVNNYLCIYGQDGFWRKVKNYIFDNTHTPWWNEDHFYYMNVYSGIFPEGERIANAFSERYLQDIPLIDYLGSFQYYEKFMPLRNEIGRGQLEALYPFFVDRPWTAALKGKKVLVIHPFDETIRNQYLNRSNIFKNNDILPDFELLTFKAVQSVAGEKVPFADWFDALKYMEDSISRIDFDICILGCGAYGLPLAAYIKRIGKKAIHMGGGTQLLFGIKGKRWEEQYERVLKYRPDATININYVDLFNEYWVYPAPTERPANALKVENACYW